MINSLFRSLFILAVSFLFVSCSPVLLYHPPVDENSPEEIFDAHVAASLLKDKAFKFEDESGTITIEFSEYKRSSWMEEYAEKKDTPKTKYEKCLLRGLINIALKERKKETNNINEKEKQESSWDGNSFVPVSSFFSAPGELPVLLVPFRQANALFFMIKTDNEYIVAKNNLSPWFVYLTHSSSLIVKVEWTDDGWVVSPVGFNWALGDFDLKRDDLDFNIMAPPEKVLKSLNDPNSYSVPENDESKMLFKPVKSSK